MSTASRVIKNTGFLYARMGISMLVALYTTRLVLNALGTTDYGIFNVVGGAIAMLGFLNASMAVATQRFMSYAEGEGKPEKMKAIFNISMVLHLIVAVIAGLGLLIIGYFFFNGILNIPNDRIFAAQVVYGSLIVSTMFTVMTVPYDAVLNAHENMKYYAIVGVIESVLKLGVAFAVVYTFMDKLVIYGILMAIIPLISMTIMRVYCHKHYSECVIAPKRYWDKKLKKEMLTFGGWDFISTGTSMISYYGIGIVLNIFFGAALNAAQGIASQVSGQLMSFSNNLMKAVSPVITKSEGGGDRSFMLHVSLQVTKVSVYLFALFAIPFMIESGFILKIWLKLVPDWAVLFVQLQLLRAVLEQLSMPMSTSISAQGQIKFYKIYVSIVNILPILLTYLSFSKGYSPYFMYLTLIFAWGFIKGGVILHFMKKNCGLSSTIYFKNVLMPAVGTMLAMILVGIIVRYFLLESFTRLILVGLGTSIVFLVMQRYLFMTKEEEQFIKKAYKKTLQKISLLPSA